MRILQALFFPPEQPGGVSSMIPHIQDRFTKLGWDMALFSLPKRVRNKGNGHVIFSTFDWKQFEGNPHVDKYMQTYLDYVWWVDMRIKESFDLIHAHHPIVALAMKQMFPDTPVIATIHSSYEGELVLNGRIEEGDSTYRFLTSLYREIEQKVDLIITPSETFKQYLGQYVTSPERIVVIPNGFDQRRFKPVAHDNEVPQLITLCRLVQAKGLDILLQACANLKERGHQFVLHIIGDGPIREQLEEMAVDLNIYEETIFYGYMLHPEQFMPFSDIFVLPSRAESFGSVFAEAALSWVSLIGTDVGGIAEQIDHEVNGLLVPVDDVEALTATIERMIVDKELRYRLAEAAYDKAKKMYSLTRVIKQLKAIYVQYEVSASSADASEASGTSEQGDHAEGRSLIEQQGGSVTTEGRK